MFPYLIAFIISIFATYNASRCKTGGMWFYIHSLFAILPLVILAAFRDPNIGTDTRNYIYLFGSALGNHIDHWNYILSHPSFEIGFLCYNFIVAKAVVNVESYYIITYGIIIGLVYMSAFKLKKSISPHIFIFIYLFLFFSDTLNVMRQYIAVSLVILAVANLFTGNNKKYLLWTIIACLFHTSALISIGIGITYWVVKKYPIHKYILLYLAICAIVLYVGWHLTTFANIGIFSTFTSKLMNHLTNKDSGDVSNSHIAVNLCTLIFLLSNYRNNRKDTAFETMLLITLFTMLFYASPFINAILYRLTVYFNVITCFAVSYVHKSDRNINNRIMIMILLALYVLFYFYSIVISGTHDVIPYSSNILEI